jgi:hypothetical protein
LKRVIFDCETNGLLNELDRVHCLVLKDVETREVVSCTNSGPGYVSIEEGLEILANAEVSYAHNGIAFDLPALKKVYPEWQLRGTFLDTLAISRLLWAHLKDGDYGRARKGRLPGHLIGSYKLEAWGYRLGRRKGEYGKVEGWEVWTQEMQDYCEDDVETTEALLHVIEKKKIPPQALEANQEIHWYLAAQERNGWPFDFEGAVRLQAKLAARREELAHALTDHFGCWYEEGKEFTPKRNNKRLGYVEGCPMTRLKLKEFNAGSRPHIANRLQTLYGWEPEKFTPKGQPEISESTLKGLDFPRVGDLIEYLTVDKRLSQISEGKGAWLKMMEDNHPDGGGITGMIHIHHSAAPVTVTHRRRHIAPNVAQVPKVTSPYGKECRELWTVPEGWQLLGADVSGLELRCLAHYMARWDDGEYGRVILDEDMDIHARNRDALGLEGAVGRDKAKTFIYAYLYGAGNEKLGSILEPTANKKKKKKTGKQLRTRFEAEIPALGKLVEIVKAKAESQGWLKLIDGRRAHVRYQHAALNTLLQGTGAVICEHWVVEADHRLMEEYDTDHGGSWHDLWAGLAWVHDEMQIATRPEIAKDASIIMVDSIEAMTIKFNFRLPLTGSASIGQTWADTH